MLLTKLHRPPITAEHIPREELIHFLNQHRHNCLTLVSAPAGYGKSVTISSWIEDCRCKYAWISLSKDDNDLRTFSNYIGVSITKAFPGSLQEFSKLISAVELPVESALSETLINELDAIEDEFVLVLDDYHLINDQKVNDLLNIIIKYPPQNMHLVLITRRDPLLDIYYLKIYGRVNEIRMNDLKFSIDEINHIVARQFNKSLNRRTVENLSAQTEGWVTGIRLAILAAKDAENPEKTLKGLSGNLNLVSEYFIREVLLQQKEEIQKLLLITSLLDSFCDELIDHLITHTGLKDSVPTKGKDFIGWLLQSNLFTIPLDDSGIWYRYHHLFQKLLQDQSDDFLSTAKIQKIRRKAFDWYEQDGKYEEAVDHSLGINDVEATVGLIMKHRYELMDSEQWTRLEKLISRVPEEYIEDNYALLTTRTLIMDLQGKFFELFPLYDKFEKALVEDKDLTGNVRGEVYAVLGIKHIFSDPGKAVEYSRSAMALLPANAQYIRTYAMYWDIIGSCMLGKIEFSENLVSETILNKRLPETCFARLYIGLCASYLMSGKTAKLKSVGHKALKLGEKHGLQESIDLAHYFLASAYYLENDIKNAELHCAVSFKNRYTNRISYVVISTGLQSMIYYRTGREDLGDATFQSLVQFVSEMEHASTEGMLTALKIERSILKNNLEDVKRLLNTSATLELPPLWFSFMPQISKLKAELIYGLSGDIESSLQTLEGYYQASLQIHNVFLQIQLLVLKAVYLWRNERHEEALALIHNSLTLGDSGGHIRTYLEYGEDMKEIFKQVESDKQSELYANQIKRYLSESFVSGNNRVKTSISSSDHLSPRETEVLALLSHGYRNKEIADQLCLSVDTIKKYLKQIFLKLNVDSRIKAAQKAKELSIGQQ